MGQLALVAGQDVEPAEGSTGTYGRWRIARRVAPDRVISTVDPQARHTRKSRSVRRDGYRGHMATEPETGLITDCEITMATGEESTDAAVGITLITRDRFHQPDQPVHTGPVDSEPVNSEPVGTEPVVHTFDGQPAGQGGAQSGLEVYGDSAYGSGKARGQTPQPDTTP